MIYRHYDKVIIVCYPKNAGGNFLINCLSLNNDSVLRSVELAQQQLDHSLSPGEKLQYLRAQLKHSRETNQWKDFGLGCVQLFGITNHVYLQEYPEVIEYQFNSVVPRLIDNKKYLFIVAHNILYIDAYLKFWPNARVIFFTEYRNFVRQRMPKINTNDLTRYWNSIRDENCPNQVPTTYDKFATLPENIKLQLLNSTFGGTFKNLSMYNTKFRLHDADLLTYIEKFKDKGHVWNVDKTFGGNSVIFLEELKKCANWTGVTVDVPDSDIQEFYKNWLNVIFNLNSD